MLQNLHSILAIKTFFSITYKRYYRGVEILMLLNIKLCLTLLPYYFKENKVDQEIMQRRSIKDKNVDRENLEALFSQILETFLYSVLASIINFLLTKILNLIYDKNIRKELIDSKYEILKKVFLKKVGKLRRKEMFTWMKKMKSAMIKIKFIYYLRSNAIEKRKQKRKLSENLILRYNDSRIQSQNTSFGDVNNNLNNNLYYMNSNNFIFNSQLNYVNGKKDINNNCNYIDYISDSPLDNGNKYSHFHLSNIYNNENKNRNSISNKNNNNNNLYYSNNLNNFNISKSANSFYNKKVSIKSDGEILSLDKKNDSCSTLYQNKNNNISYINNINNIDDYDASKEILSSNIGLFRKDYIDNKYKREEYYEADRSSVKVVNPKLRVRFSSLVLSKKNISDPNMNNMSIRKLSNCSATSSINQLIDNKSSNLKLNSTTFGTHCNRSSRSLVSRSNVSSNRKISCEIKDFAANNNNLPKKEKKVIYSAISTSDQIRILIKNIIGTIFILISWGVSLVIIKIIYQNYRNSIFKIVIIPVITAIVMNLILTEVILIFIFTTLSWINLEIKYFGVGTVVSRFLGIVVNPLIQQIHKTIIIIRDLNITN